MRIVATVNSKPQGCKTHGEGGEEPDLPYRTLVLLGRGDEVEVVTGGVEIQFGILPTQGHRIAVGRPACLQDRLVSERNKNCVIRGYGRKSQNMKDKFFDTAIERESARPVDGQRHGLPVVHAGQSVRRSDVPRTSHTAVRQPRQSNAVRGVLAKGTAMKLIPRPRRTKRCCASSSRRRRL